MPWDNSFTWNNLLMWRPTLDELPLYEKQTLVINTGLVYASTPLQTWQEGTSLMLANFENNLEAGNFFNGDLPITEWRIRRKADNETLYSKLADIDVSNTEFWDFTCGSKVNYTYRVFALSNGIEGTGLEETGMTSWYGWILESNYVAPATPTTQFLFDSGIDSTIQTSDIAVKKGYQLIENFSRFPAFRFNNRKYREMTITTMPYDDSTGDYVIDLAVLESLNTFLNDGQMKILRNGAGETWKVITIDMTYKYRDELSDQPFVSSFRVVEVAE